MRVRLLTLPRPWAASAVLLLASAVVLPLRADQFPRQPGITILQYRFAVTVSGSSNELEVADTVALRFVADGVRVVTLNLCNLVTTPQAPDPLNPCLQQPRRGRGAQAAAPPTSVGRGMTVTSVTADGQPLRYTHQNDRLRVEFPAPARAGQSFTFTVSYHGIPASGLYIGPNRFGDRVFFTDNWPNRARNWLATIDHISVKAPKTIAVTAPSDYQVISNGKRTEVDDLANGMRRTVWTESQPIPSWQYSLGIAHFSVDYFGTSRGVPFSAWIFPQDRQQGEDAFVGSTRTIFDFYSSHIGPYAYEKLAQVEAAGSSGATEPATTIFYYGGRFGASAHEMAHHWFGDSVTESDWDDVWLSEGFATYFALLYTEFHDGHDAFLEGVRRTAARARTYEQAHPQDTVVHNNLKTASLVFSNSAQIYQGGAMVLHMLRGVLGDKLFWAGIRLYYHRHYDASASSADFQHAMEDACLASGQCPPQDRDLSWFFHEWLHRGGFLHLDGTWHYDAQAQQLQITLRQTQAQGNYRMPLQIGITTAPAAGTPTAGSARVATIWLEPGQQAYALPLAQAPRSVQLDPQDWVPMMAANWAAQP